MKKLAPLYLLLFLLLLGMACRRENPLHFQTQGAHYELDYPADFRPEPGPQKLRRYEGQLQNVSLFRDRDPRLSLDHLLRGPEEGTFIAQGRWFELSPILKKAFEDNQFAVIRAALGGEVRQRFIHGQMFYLLQPQPTLLVALTLYRNTLYTFYYAQQDARQQQRQLRQSLHSIRFHYTERQRTSAGAQLVSGPLGPPRTEPAVLRPLAIRAIHLLQLPQQRPDGRDWDHLAPSPFTHPDVYCTVSRAGRRLSSNRHQPWDNLRPDQDLPRCLVLDGPPGSSAHELRIRVYDADWEIDGGAKLMLEFGLDPAELQAGQKHYYRADPEGHWQVELDLTWE